MLDQEMREPSVGQPAAAVPGSFAVTRRVLPDGAIGVVLSGELDLASAPLAAEQVAAAQEQSPLVWLDLRELSFMDSSGLHMIISADARARSRGERLTIIHGSDAVRRVFELTAMHERLELVDGPADGLDGHACVESS